MSNIQYNDNWLDEYKKEIHRIGQKYPTPCKEMAQEAVNFVCSKLNEPYSYLKNSEEEALISWEQRQFVGSLCDRYYKGKEFKFAEIWNKYAPELIKEKGYICHAKAEVKRPWEYSIFW